MARDLVLIDDLRVDCIIGVFPEERETPQPLRIDVEFALDLSQAGHSGRIRHTVDYDVASRHLAAMLAFRRYGLLETAAHELAAMLLGLHDVVDEVKLRISKPRALKGRAENAAVQIRRSRSDLPRRRETTAFGEAEILLETAEAGLYLLHVGPGRSIAPHHHLVMRELEWIQRGSLVHPWSGEHLAPQRPTVWAMGQAHGYTNPTTDTATLFCCDVPPFIPTDEIVLDTTAPSQPEIEATNAQDPA